MKKDGGNALGLYQTFMSARPLEDAAIDPLARRNGAQPADMSAAADRAYDAHLADNGALFNKLSLGGTPAFIVGDQIILGEDMDAVNAAIKQQRAKKA